jgi:hypothetical protein
MKTLKEDEKQEGSRDLYSACGLVVNVSSQA